MKKILLPLAMPLLMIFMSSCSEDDVSATSNNRKDIVLSRSETQMAEENIKFAFSFFNKVDELESDKDNWMVSPFSASVALSMIANGTGENTFEEIKKALGFDDFSLEEMNEYYRKLNSELKYLDNTAQLYMANSIWTDNGIDVYNSFAETNKNVFGAQISTLDLSSSNALKNINDWCAQQTNNTIPVILDNIPEDVKACFLNAIYFKGIWKNKFNTSDTSDQTFYNADGQSNLVKMMKQTESFNYTTNESFSIAEFPYGNEAFSMVVLLPNENKTLEESLRIFTADYWMKDMEMSMRKLNVLFPLFEMNYETDLINVMKEMGVSDAFNIDNADFSLMTSSSVYLNLLKQATYIKVDEKGTEAASVTLGAGMNTDAGPTTTIDFFINRPFAFLIKEKSTGNILYMGKVTRL